MGFGGKSKRKLFSSPAKLSLIADRLNGETLMYFDFAYYRKVVAFAWAQKDWPGRSKMLVKLLLVVPLVSVLHALFFLLDYLFFPALWRQKVVEPVFVVGHARSGTTLMHRLLASDGDRFSYFLYWEMFFPALTEKAIVRAVGFIDRTLLKSSIQKRLEQWDEKTFGPWRHIHNQGLWIPEEDQFVMNAAFLSQQWALDLPLMHEVDIFHVDNLKPIRRRRWMNHYKACVKRQLVYRGGNKTHLSKNPVMSGWVGAILDTFPDAKIVVMVRDPVQCIPSTLRLVEMSWSSKQWTKQQYAKSQQALTDISFDCFILPKKALDQRPETPHYFVDYRELTSAPKSTIESVYQTLGLTLSPTYYDYLTRHEEKEKKHSSHYSYSLDDYVITAEEIELRLRDFYEQYQWPRLSEMNEFSEVENGK